MLGQEWSGLQKGHCVVELVTTIYPFIKYILIAYFAQAFAGHYGDESGQDSRGSGYFGAYNLAVWKGRSLAQNHTLPGYLVCR